MVRFLADSVLTLVSHLNLLHSLAVKRPVKHIVSVSLGSAKRDYERRVELLGREVRLERLGTNGDLRKAAALIRECDGAVDAIGLGGIDLYFHIGARRYTLRDAARLARQAKVTPVVDGSGLKQSLEKCVVRELDDVAGWRGKRVLMVSALDRYGMATALEEVGARVLYGDAIFGLGLPVPIYGLKTFRRAAKALLPLVTELPISWLYPTGDKQDVDESNSFSRFYDWADVIAGDWHLIRRYLPERVDGKVFLTNTTTEENVNLLRERGAATLITTTPRYEGRSLATNVLEAALVALSSEFPLSPSRYNDLTARLDVHAGVLELKR